MCSDEGAGRLGGAGCRGDGTWDGEGGVDTVGSEEAGHGMGGGMQGMSGVQEHEPGLEGLESSH